MLTLLLRCALVFCQGGQDFLDTEDDVCGEWASNFFLAQGFTALAAGVVAVVNAVLKVVLART